LGPELPNLSPSSFSVGYGSPPRSQTSTRCPSSLPFPLCECISVLQTHCTSSARRFVPSPPSCFLFSGLRLPTSLPNFDALPLKLRSFGRRHLFLERTRLERQLRTHYSGEVHTHIHVCIYMYISVCVYVYLYTIYIYIIFVPGAHAA